ncbi:hypothetical protein L226DRAFT_564839 [Lentinus tigrinus ALCF2SS1-7]|uniref:uncharacterized protein n=1 Tax=Lentinus tigrinus ALCF2SS1-7 TaxID=1328758 RepID=UPI001165F8D6|nr:hypothetical protein L226DRAFT_564839 [Lentinus tigrinus ALCF2SS1-7]
MFRAALVAAFFYTLSVVAFLAHGAAVSAAKRDITDPFKSIASDVKSAVDGIETAVETIGKDVVTVVKDASGEAFTLATDGVGLATTIAGQAYTIITTCGHSHQHWKLCTRGARGRHIVPVALRCLDLPR